MSANSKIEWCDHTFNTHWGCSKISPGCDGCYAERLAARFGYGWGDDAQKREFDEKHWQELLRWDRKAQAEGVRRRVFTNSMSDLFDKFAPAGVRERHFGYVERTPHLDHLLLTKRIGNVARMVPQRWLEPGGWPANAWLGATVVNQAEADRDVPKLLTVPARVHFLSMEPLLGPVDLRKVAVPAQHDQLRRPWDYEGYKFNALQEHDDDRFHQAPATIDWVIVGGESGPGARPMHPDWARSLRDQCEAAGVPLLFKQWGEWVEPDIDGMPTRLTAREGDPEFFDAAAKVDGFLCVDGRFETNIEDLEDDVRYLGMKRVGKKAAGRLLDGREWNEVPTL